MNKRIRNFKAIDHPLHHTFLNYFPVLIMIAIALFSLTLWKAQRDQKMVADNLRARMEAPAPRQSIIYYRVLKDDTLESIAATFNVSTQTLLWANDLPENTLSPDMVIVIPAVNGVVHEVKKGDTTEKIAQLYNTKVENIISFPYNTFEDEEMLIPRAGQMLMVPGGRKTDSDNVLGEFFRRILDMR